MPKRLIHTSDDLAADHWMARQLPRGISLRPFAEDEAISVLTSAVQDAIEDAGLTRSDVARLLGTTKSYVSQVLNGSTNMTLKTLGALLWACGLQVGALRTDVLGAEIQPQPAEQPAQRPILSVEMKSAGYDTKHIASIGMSVPVRFGRTPDFSHMTA